MILEMNPRGGAVPLICNVVPDVGSLWLTVGNMLEILMVNDGSYYI